MTLYETIAYETCTELENVRGLDIEYHITPEEIRANNDHL